MGTLSRLSLLTIGFLLSGCTNVSNEFANSSLNQTQDNLTDFEQFRISENISESLNYSTNNTTTSILDTTCPPSCEDDNPCTEDICSLETNHSCVHVPLNGTVEGCSDTNDSCKFKKCVKGTCLLLGLFPCCGNGICEYDEEETCDMDCLPWFNTSGLPECGPFHYFEIDELSCKHKTPKDCAYFSNVHLGEPVNFRGWNISVIDTMIHYTDHYSTLNVSYLDFSTIRILSSGESSQFRSGHEYRDPKITLTLEQVDSDSIYFTICDPCNEEIVGDAWNTDCTSCECIFYCDGDLGFLSLYNKGCQRIPFFNCQRHDDILFEEEYYIDGWFFNFSFVERDLGNENLREFKLVAGDYSGKYETLFLREGQGDRIDNIYFILDFAQFGRIALLTCPT